MNRPSNVPTTLLNASRFILAGAIAFGAFGSLLEWQRSGWHTAVSPIAQVLGGVACIVALWRPRDGLILGVVPMALTLLFGNLEADLLIALILPAVFVASAGAVEAAAVLALFGAYVLARSAGVQPWWEMAGSYAVLILPGIAAGAALRVLRIASLRGQVGVQMMEEDARRIRGEERAQLSAELRSLVAVRLADGTAVLAAAHRLTDPAAMRAAVARVNQTCLGALGEVRELVGILREDPTAAGRDESVAGPKATTSLVLLRDRLERGGVKVRAAILVELDRVSSVTQSTLTRVMEEIVDAVLASDPVGAEVVVSVDRRRGWIDLDVSYPAPGALDDGHEHRMNRLRQRAEALGGSLKVDTHGGVCALHLSLPPAMEPTTETAGRDRPPGWWRWLTPGTARGAMTMLLTFGGFAAGAGLADSFRAGQSPWEEVWEVAGFAAAGVLLWWPAVGAVPAAVAAVGMLLTPHSDDVALAVIFLVGCWQAARMSRRRAAIGLSLLASGALIVATIADVGAMRERAVVASVVLVALPAFVAARHYLQTRRRQLDEMAGLLRTTEGIRVEERNLLARELHDVVAHHLSVATLQSMAYGESDDPAELRTALTRMERSIKGAEEEMELLSRIMAGAGAEDSGMALVRPTTVVGVLAETLRDNGFRVSVSVDPQADSLPAPTLRTLTRVMQEGVTNILRYGRRDGACRLTLTVHAHEVTLRISNALPTRRRTSPLSLGYGLAGIRERVDLLGGRFAVSDDEDTWVVGVSLPHAV